MYMAREKTGWAVVLTDYARATNGTSFDMVNYTQDKPD
jgi:hypothetical protein